MEYFFAMTEVAASRSSCPRLAVGCVLAVDDRMVSSGYNGAGPDEPHCLDEGCEMEGDHCVRATHAEENAIFNAARFGIALQGATAYVTYTPCRRCRRALKSAGIVAIHHLKEYRNG